MNTDTRYPYTYAADYIREEVGMRDGSTILSRADAARAIDATAVVFGISAYEFSCKLADAFLAKQEDS